MRAWLGVSAVLVLSAVVLAQTPVLQDTAGQALVVTGHRSWQYQRLPNNRIRLTIKGTPVAADWKREDVKLAANELVMVATNRYELITANLSGSIRFEADRPSASGKGRQLLTLDAPRAEYTAESQTIEVPGKLEVVRNDPNAGEKLTASGSGGTIVLSGQRSNESALQKATLRGPVVLNLRGKRDEDGKTLPFRLDGRGDRLEFNDPERRIVLSGNVSLSGDDPALAGQMKGITRAIIKLDAQRQIDSIDLEGEPGTTIIEQKTPPPTRR